MGFKMSRSVMKFDCYPYICVNVCWMGFLKFLTIEEIRLKYKHHDEPNSLIIRLIEQGI